MQRQAEHLKRDTQDHHLRCPWNKLFFSWNIRRLHLTRGNNEYYLEDHSGDPAAQLEAADWEESSQRQLMGALESLDERSRDILMQRWLSEEKATLHDLADRYGVSAERIRQLEKNAMKKIKAAMTLAA